jgi:hypothetical protein
MDNQLYGIFMNYLFSLTLSSGNATMGDGIELEYPIYSYDESNEIIFSSTVVGFNNTIYYYSINSEEKDNNGYVVYSYNISDETTSKISEVSSIHPLVTDNKNKLWIFDDRNVIEYNTATNKITKFIAPTNLATGHSEASFYMEDNLYYIGNQEIYKLDLSKPRPKPAPKPKKNRIPWIGPITPGYQFTSYAIFLPILSTLYMITEYNGEIVLFEYDPITDNFYSALILNEKSFYSYDSNSNIIQNDPVVSSVDYKHTFSDEKCLYSYDSASNTITCKNIKTKMTKKIACYENMPEDIVQIVYANNLVYILTESGKNHIARIAGSNLKYVSGWKLNNCTPRTGVAIATVNNAIYVFGGKALADDSKEASSGTCYNELYVYDIATKSSKKLEVPEDVTARYDAKMVASQRSGKLWILSGKDDSDSKALDVWEFNTRSQKWEYINDLPQSDGDNSVGYDDKNDILTLLITPESEGSNLFSMNNTLRDIPQASSGAVIYKLQNLSTVTNTAEQSGHNCGCLGLEFIFAIVGLFIFRHCHKN